MTPPKPANDNVVQPLPSEVSSWPEALGFILGGVAPYIPIVVIGVILVLALRH